MAVNQPQMQGKRIKFRLRLDKTHLFEQIAGKSEDVEEGGVSER